MCIRIKICGITDTRAARTVAAIGADAAGFVFTRSPRRVSFRSALAMSRHLSESVRRVAVLKNPSRFEVSEVLQKFSPDALQCEPNPETDDLVLSLCEFLPVFHDNKDLLQQVTAWREKNGFDGTVLIEGKGRGGRGIRPSWNRAAQLARRGSLALAGGLDAENVARALDRVRPDWVDASSGLEKMPGRKSAARIIDFVEEVRRFELMAEKETE